MEEKKEVQKQSLSNCSIKEYCDLLENDRYVGGGSSAPIMSAVAMSLLIKILNVVKKKNKDFSSGNDIETRLKKFRDIYLWLADKDVEVYNYAINCYKRLKELKSTDSLSSIYKKIKILSACPSSITIANNTSPDLYFCIGYITECCPDNMSSDLAIAINFINASISSAESTLKINLGEEINIDIEIKDNDEIDEYKKMIEKMITDIESREYTIKDNIDSLLDTLKYVYDKDNGVDKATIVQDGTNVVINISPEFFNIVSEILVSKFLSTDNK
jgi:hypothetical protein